MHACPNTIMIEFKVFVCDILETDSKVLWDVLVWKGFQAYPDLVLFFLFLYRIGTVRSLQNFWAEKKIRLGWMLIAFWWRTVVDIGHSSQESVNPKFFSGWDLLKKNLNIFSYNLTRIIKSICGFCQAPCTDSISSLIRISASERLLHYLHREKVWDILVFQTDLAMLEVACHKNLQR